MNMLLSENSKLGFSDSQNQMLFITAVSGAPLGGRISQAFDIGKNLKFLATGTKWTIHEPLEQRWGWAVVILTCGWFTQILNEHITQGTVCTKQELETKKTQHLSSRTVQVEIAQRKKLKCHAIKVPTDSLCCLNFLLPFQGYFCSWDPPKDSLLQQNLCGTLINLRSTPGGTKALAGIQTLWFHRVWAYFKFVA